MSASSEEIYTIIEYGDKEVKIENAYEDTGVYKIWRSTFDDAVRTKLFKLL